jgi:hypothetical protein
MKAIRFVALAVLIWTFAAVTPAQSEARLPKIVQEAIEGYRKDCQPERFETSKGFVDVRDINGDKRPDYILNYGAAQCGDASTFYCGTGGCLTQVIASLDDGTYAQVLDENVRRLRFARVKGRPAMLLDLHGSACGRAGAEPCAMTLYWNGSTFSAAN